MPDDARGLIAQYLQSAAGGGNDASNANISRVLQSLNTNPDLVPGLHGMSPISSPGDPSSLPVPPIPPSLQPRPTARAVSPPTQRAPGEPGAPTPQGAGLDLVSLSGLANSITTNTPPPAPAAPNAPAVPPVVSKPPDAPRVDDDPVNTGVAAKPFVPNQPPAPNAPTRAPILPQPAAITNAQAGNTDTSAAEGSYFRPTVRGPVELPQTTSQYTESVLPPWLRPAVQSPFARGLIDYLGARYNDPTDFINQVTAEPGTVSIADRIRTGTGVAAGLVGGGVDAQMTRPVRTGAKPITSSVGDAATKVGPQPFGPTRSGVSEQPIEPVAKEATSRDLSEQLKRLQIQARIDQLKGGGGGTTSAPPRPTQAAPGRANTPTAQAESPTTSNATPSINMGATPPPVEPVPLAEMIRTQRSPVNEILSGTRPPDLTQPVNPMPHVPTGEVVPVDVPQATEPFRNTRYGGPIKHQQPPTPIRGEVTGGTNNAYNIPGTEQPITPTVAPVATGRAQTSVPPPVEVPAPGATMQAPAPASPIDLATLLHEPVPTGSPTVAPMRQPAPVSQVPLPVNMPPTVANVGGVREIPIGNQPMVEAVQRKIAGPKRELTRADVPAEETAGQSMARRLRERNKARR